ncbi:transposase [Sphaerochaeta sp. S2]|uniref:IS110 family transposase n=1 Tax=Sphaerochaeta sp. S2 TaxID=2798868 RepID=UPI001E2CD3C0|nr:transposase [Sphaerochaeta sp. S2]
MILKYIEGVRDKYPKSSTFLCGYEAGCLGYSLYHELKNHNVDCKILAPTTMAITNNRRVKTDKRDAGNIARCLALKTYSEVYVPSAEDNAIKDFIRMRDDHMKMLKSTKQQILAFTLRNGFKFEEGKTYWTLKHMSWLRTLKIDGVFKETLDEYLVTYEQLLDRIERLDQRIEELALGEKYNENVKMLNCFIGIKTHTSLSFLAEIGDFNRFAKAGNFSSFLGLTTW